MRLSRTIGVGFATTSLLVGTAGLAAAMSPTVPVTWKEGKTFPSTATRFDGARVGSKVYFLGFRIDDAGTTDGSVWYYDLKKDKYVDTGTDMPVPISNYTVAVLKDAKGTGLYTFGGRDQNGKILKTVQVYYPSSNKASVVKSDPWPGKTPSDCVSLPATGVAVVKNVAYVMGGMSFSSSIPACVDDNSKQTWAFDPMANEGKRWSAGPKLNVARGYITPAVVGSTIYAIGGDTNDAATLTPTTTVESWKVGASAWKDKGVADLPEACDESQAFGYASGPLADTVTLAGCGQWPNALPDVLQYNITKDKWNNVGALNEARRNHAGADIGSAKSPKMMVVGGYNSDGTAILDTSEIGKPGAALRAGARTPVHGSSSAGKASLF